MTQQYPPPPYPPRRSVAGTVLKVLGVLVGVAFVVLFALVVGGLVVAQLS